MHLHAQGRRSSQGHRSSTARHVTLVAFASWATALWALPASAYCRTRLCEFPEYPERCTWDPQTKCSTTSRFVYWPSGCISFAVQRDGSAAERISARELESLVAEGFRVWSELDCGAGASPELAARSQGPIACAAVEYDCERPEANSNLITFRDEFEDTEAFRYGTLALTTATAHLGTGELLDADIEINSRDEDFVLDGSSALRLSEARDLRSVVYHELGHLLGLSHSEVSGALMRSVYTGSVEQSEDDRRGICDALGANVTDPPCESVALGADTACLGSDDSCRDVAALPSAAAGCSCALPESEDRNLARELLALFGACVVVSTRRGLNERA